ncbi:Ferric reduction oxidase 2 [Nymphaea thermarum]|nr:Ferric reduction oxidase 2 [Nymphaea thermarum]
MSTMFINIPSISTLQWHLFLVTSDSSLEEDELTVVIKSEEDERTKVAARLCIQELNKLHMLDLLLPVSPSATKNSSLELQVEA